MSNKNNTNPLLHALLPIIITVTYVLIGTIFDSGWAIGWILFLLIPIVETLVKAINTKNPSHFAYPVLVTAIFLFTGMMWGWWHPMWVLFVTIPAYYAICDAINKSKPHPEVEENYNYAKPNETTANETAVTDANQGTYYQPQVNTNYQPQANTNYHSGRVNITAIIITVIVCIAVVAIVGIVFTFSWLNDKVEDNIFDYEIDSSYTAGPAEISTNDIECIKVEWVNGNVDVDYYDGDTINISEDGDSENNPMCYKVENRTLYISEYKKTFSTISKSFNKDLIIQIPMDFVADEFAFEIVSANINADELKTLGLDIETVSGNSNVTFSKQPQKIDVESVSGDINIAFPEDITGYSVSKESVSGSFRANDFDNSTRFGDGYTVIDFESVSGNLNINKK